MLNRKRFSPISVKVGMLFSRLPLTPNQWTLFSILPAILSAYFLVNEEFLPAAMLFGTAAFFDIVDGSVARVTGRVTKRGAYLDTMADRYVEGAVVFSMLVVFPGIAAWIFLYLFGSMATTYAKAAAKEKLDASVRGGLLERPERLILLFVVILLAAFDRLYFAYLIMLLAILVNVTALQRIYIALKKKNN